MSTRANIVVEDKYERLIFYRHSDGDPDGALPTLKKFMQYIKKEKIRNNVEQASGWLIMLGAQEYNMGYDYKAGGRGKFQKTLEDILTPSCDWKVGAYEPSTCIHGDIEFLYVLDLDKMEIRIYNPGDSDTIDINKIKYMKLIETIRKFD